MAPDEATSALDVTGQAELMQLDSRLLPGLTLINIGHRPELEGFNARKLTLEAAPPGARRGGSADRARASRQPPAA